MTKNLYSTGKELLNKEAMPKFLTELGKKIKGNKYVDAFSKRKSSASGANDFGLTEGTKDMYRKGLRKNVYKGLAVGGGVAGAGAAGYAVGKQKKEASYYLTGKELLKQANTQKSIDQLIAARKEQDATNRAAEKTKRMKDSLKQTKLKATTGISNAGKWIGANKGKSGLIGAGIVGAGALGTYLAKKKGTKEAGYQGVWRRMKSGKNSIFNNVEKATDTANARNIVSKMRRKQGLQAAVVGGAGVATGVAGTKLTDKK